MISAALSLLSCSQSYASGPFSGFYAGVLGGGSFLSGNENFVIFQRRNGVIGHAIPIAHGFKDNSLIGMAVLGYGVPFCNGGYLGGELFADWSNHKPTTTNLRSIEDIAASYTEYNSRVRVEPVSWGFDLRPGYQIADCSLLYTRVGVGVKRITHYFTNYTRLTGDAGPVTTTHSFSRGITRGVLRLGIGFEQALTDNLSFRADYIYSYLGSYYATGASSVATVVEEAATLLSTNTETRHHLYNNTVLFGLNWYW